MTTTKTLLDRLAQGELSSTKAGDTGTILTAELPKVLMNLNKAMDEMYARKELFTREILVRSTLEITHYYLRDDYLASNDASSEPVKYLDDSLCTFEGSKVVKILDVYDAFGRQLFMNKAMEPLSVFTPQYDCLQITANHQSLELYVIYQSLHPTLQYDETTDPDTDTNVEIPPALITPLLQLAASNYFSDMGTDAAIAKGSRLRAEYELAIDAHTILDTDSTSPNYSNQKLERNGFE